MITPIRTMTIDQICERKDDLLIGSDDVKALAKGERNKAIDEFTNALNNSPNIYKWSCRDLTLKSCNGDDCDKCENEFMKEIFQIAEQMKGE